MKNPTHKKAFTLTELLVVVIVIGILAAVSLPKFNKVLETRKTTEAEELLGSVRNEQEKRCTLDKKYTGSFKTLGQTNTDSATLDSKYYSYALKQGGAQSASKGKNYSIAIPSYKDGRLCCEGAYCSSLNKDYPSCESLKAKSDYQSAEASCLASLCEVARQCNPGGTDTKSCECGSQSRTCDSECQWGSYTGTCYNKYGGTGSTRGCSSGCGSQTSVSTCSGESWSGSCWSPSGGGSTRACSSGCGTQTSVSTCSGASWTGSCWSPSGGRTETKNCQELQSNLRGTTTRTCSDTCSGTPSCPDWTTAGCTGCTAPSGDATSQPCPSGYTGTQTRTWNSSTCSWNAWQGTCTPESKECTGTAPASEQGCGGCSQKQTRSVTCDTSTGNWTTGSWSACPADPVCSGPSSQACPSGQTGTQTRTCSCGVWSDWTGTCTAKKYKWVEVRSDHTYSWGGATGCYRPQSNGCSACDSGCAAEFNSGDCYNWGVCYAVGETCEETRAWLDPQYACNECEIITYYYECRES